MDRMVKRVVDKVKRLGNDFLFSTGFLAGQRLKNTPHTILMYHGVDSSGDIRFNSRHTAVGDFSRHIQFLNTHCNIIPLRDFFEKKFIEGRPNVALTFDDGYRNNLTYALPVLEKEKAPATFYITGLNNTSCNILWPDFLNIASTLTNETIVIEGEQFARKNNVYHSLETGENLYHIIKHKRADFDYKLAMIDAFKGIYDFRNDPAFDDYWKLMTDKEIRKCSESDFIEIGSHGFFHNNLGTIPLVDASKEIADSKAYLEAITNKSVVAIGYPDGSYSHAVIAAAEKRGFITQAAGEGFINPEDENDNRIRDRKGIYTWDTCANQLLINL